MVIRCCGYLGVGKGFVWLFVVVVIWRNQVQNIITFVHLNMEDILNTADLNLLVDKFYQKLLSDNSISYIFTDVVKINLEAHLPILVTFWSQAIFNTGGYFNNLTQIHLDISEKEYLTFCFDQYIRLFLLHIL